MPANYYDKQTGQFQEKEDTLNRGQHLKSPNGNNNNASMQMSAISFNISVAHQFGKQMPLIMATASKWNKTEIYDNSAPLSSGTANKGNE